MRRGTLYVLMFAVPVLLAATVIALAVFALAAGFVWLFVAGDDPWPGAADTALLGVFTLAFAVAALALARAAYAAGHRREGEAALDTRHVAGAVLATALLLAGIVGYQWRVGNIGAKPDAVLCSEHCLASGFPASGMPPRDAGAATCTCMDAQGRETASVPLREIAPVR